MPSSSGLTVGCPLFKDSRELILRKCDPGRRAEVANIFGKQPFGDLERLITQKLLDVTQGVARNELRNEVWLRSMAELSQRSYEQMRVAILEFLDTDVFSISLEGCASFLNPMIEFWNIDLRTFALEGGEELRGEAQKMVERAVARRVETTVANFETPDEWDWALLQQELLMHYVLPVPEFAEDGERSPEEGAAPARAGTATTCVSG